MKHFSRWLVLGILLAGLLVAAYLWQHRQEQTAPVPIDPPPTVSAAPALPPASAPEAASAAAPPILHPIEPIELSTQGATTLPPLDASDPLLKQALSGAIGRQALLMFLNLDSFVRRVVATTDNLARGHAAARLWPVVPTSGRFLVLERGDGSYMADGNTERYLPFVRFASAVDTAQLMAVYEQLYPLFQQAYEELGYPGQYFNDRVIEVIDQLLQTPVLSGPLKLVLTQVQGPIPATRPWVRYEFADPDLEARPAGQKILLRLGPANANLLKAKLAEIRQYLVAGKPAR